MQARYDWKQDILDNPSRKLARVEVDHHEGVVFVSAVDDQGEPFACANFTVSPSEWTTRFKKQVVILFTGDALKARGQQ
jgi:hypothetical protein